MEANTPALGAWGMAEGHKTILMTKLTESKTVPKEKPTPSQGGWLSPEASFCWGLALSALRYREASLFSASKGKRAGAYLLHTICSL